MGKAGHVHHCYLHVHMSLRCDIILFFKATEALNFFYEIWPIDVYIFF